MKQTEASSDIVDDASKAILGPNPFVGFRAEDIAAAAGALANEAATRPTLLLEQQAAFIRNIASILAGKSELKPSPKDKRFADPAWSENPFYRAYLSGYLAWTSSIEGFIEKSSFDRRTKDQTRFVTQLITDALAPSNMPINPAAVKKAIDTGGSSVADGLKNMLTDIAENGGMPAQVDKKPFELGKNVAATPGSVVFRNDIIEVIQYKPKTEQVHAIPLLFVPPQINKFYVFDISPGKSIIEHMLDGGLTCFVISWRNPTAAQRDWGLDKYVSAIISAIDVARDITKSEKVNAIAACAGAMTLSALLGYYAASDEESPLNSATLLVAVLDSEAESTIGLFMTPDAAKAAKANSARRGVLDGEDMSRIFAWLRPNDLIWNYWVNNYLLGNSPPPFDILFWNADTTRLPATLHGQLVDAYSDNSFKKAGALTVLGKKIDLHEVSLDSYFVAGITDHITPWKGVYSTMKMFGGRKSFVLSAAGHIQSLINPPADGAKRQYFLNEHHPERADEWLEGAKAHKGSWWGHWVEWLQHHGGELVPAAAKLGSTTYPETIEAPGKYVLEK